MDLRAGIFILLLGVTLSSAQQLPMQCGFRLETDDYTCVYEGGITITNTVTWGISHLAGFTNANVRALIIRGSMINGLPATTFTGFLGLQHLFILNSPAVIFETNLVTPLLALRNITISNNQQLIFGPTSFQMFPNIRFLEISSNTMGLTLLPSNMFQTQVNLQYLDMSNNNPLVLQPNMFSTLASLRTLNLNGSSITFAGSFQFLGLANLLSLHMHNCRISVIPDNVFAPLTNLIYLELGQNDITRLQSGIFAGLFNLRELDLRMNNIGFLAHDAFIGLPNLQILDLSENPNIVYAAPFFIGLGSLHSLVLSRNEIQPDQLTPDVMSLLTNLRRIDLSHNNITRVVSGLFRESRHLSVIDLSNNGVESIEFDIFDQFINAEVRINLEGNNCTNFNFIVFNRNFLHVQAELLECFNNFIEDPGFNVAKIEGTHSFLLNSK